jgi:hypothetical protein
MARVKAPTGSSNSKPKLRPALTPEAKENQMVSLAMDLVEQRLRDGTASSQETTHFLKLASSKARLENERLQEENKLLRAKTKAIENAESNAHAYEQVIRALREYNGKGEDDEYDEYY